jgi:hypothetical protein
VKIPFIGPSAPSRSPDADAERTVNAYVEPADSPRAPAGIYGMPGLVLAHTMGTGPHRGAFKQRDDSYFVSGNHVFRRDGAGVVVDCGAITTSTGRVGMASNGTEVLIVDGVKGWLVTGTLLSEIIDPDFPNGVTNAAFLNGYFVVWGDGSQLFHWSENPNSGIAWDGLDFAAVEGNPDDLVGGVADHGQMWFIGTDSGEVFDNVADPDQPFQRSGSSFIEYGTVSPWTVCAFDNSVVWLSRSKDGHGVFIRTQGGNPQRFSTHALEHAISTYTTIADAYAYTFQMDGHSFYVVTFPTADATWFFDAASGLWAEWLWRDPAFNELHRHRSATHVFAAGKHLVGDWETGKVYELRLDAYTDAGDLIPLIRRAPAVYDEGRLLTMQELQIDCETGVANADCADPKLLMRYYRNDAKVPSTWQPKSIGKTGQYGKQVRFHNLGQGRAWSFEISITDPVKRAIFGANARVAKGRGG